MHSLMLSKMLSPGFLSSITLCSSSGKQQTPNVNGMFSVCSGTSGAGAGKATSVAGTKIENEDPSAAITYLAQYVYNKANACVSGFNPACDTKSNYVPYQTAFGCCSAAKDWEALQLTVLNDNSSYATTLKAFSTASKPGAQDSAVLDNGIPTELIALEKVWGFSKANWVHGGVISANVGIFRAGRGQPFTINYTSKLPGSVLQSWKQYSLLWTRQIGDTYDSKLDFYYNDAVKVQPGIFEVKTPGSLPKACNACNAEGDVNTIFGNAASTGCTTPYFQACPEIVSLTSSHLKDPANPYANSVIPNTKPPVFNGYTDPYGRTGGCFVTNSMYGPSTVSVLANLPPVMLPLASASNNDPLYDAAFPWIDQTTGKYVAKNTPGANPGGRGYVFAIWTFGYTENYQTSSPNHTSFNTAVRESPPNDGLQQTTVTAEGYSSSLASSPGIPTLANVQTTLQQYDGVAQEDSDDDVFVSHNHEIDIELPCNSGQASNNPDMLKVLGWNTANLNTWLTDIDNYDPGTEALYQQVQASLPTVDGKDDGQKQYFFAVNPSETEDTYHKYSFTWYVDPEYDASDPKKNQVDNSYVAFYFDDALIYKTKRFVPRRSGRVVIGLWPAWWGTNHFPMTFNSAYARIARIDIVPQMDIDGNVLVSRVTNSAQVYDQNFPIKGGHDSKDLSIKCGFTSDIPRQPVRNDSVNVISVKPLSGQQLLSGQIDHLKDKAAFSCSVGGGLSTLDIILITIGCVVAVLALSLGLYYGLKKRKLNPTLPKSLPISSKT